MKLFFYQFRDYEELEFCEKYSKEYGIEYGTTPLSPSPETAELCRGYEAVSMNPSDMSAPVIEKMHEAGVKYICGRSIGYDHIDLAAAERCGMRVSNASYPPEAVANYAIMLMLMCLRKMNIIMERAAVQDFTLPGKMGRDISFSTVGVIGTGKIGTTVLRHLSGFGCRLLCSDPYENEEAKKYAEYVDYDTLYRECDVITLHTNATEENYHILNADAFAKMKDGVVIINTARGSLIDTDALIDALESGKTGAAGLDVIEHEMGLYYNNKVTDVIANKDFALLRTFPNVVITPHTAFYTRASIENMVKSAFDSALAFEKGEPTFHEVKF
ncbi:MAG: D-isomer specific 2-hydroxyacid dehydrogenase family protein [Lachnospiraceae bacterium]|nr:D-isomer specific 2-hydroxyacid dehydrogenase family protein [Lachnospiraceae bacterium]